MKILRISGYVIVGATLAHMGYSVLNIEFWVIMVTLLAIDISHAADD